MAVWEGMMTTRAFTGSDQQYSPRLRDRQRSAEMAAKPQQQVEQDRIAEICLAAYKEREAAARAEEARQIAAGRIRIL
jgi:hypothetical protein